MEIVYRLDKTYTLNICLANSTWTQVSIPIFNFYFKSVKRLKISYVFWNKISYLWSLYVIHLVPYLTVLYCRNTGNENFRGCKEFFETRKNRSSLEGIAR